MSIPQIEQALRAHRDAMLQATRADLEAIGQDAAQEMQASAPWQDQTGNARRGLASVPDHPADGGAVHLVHGVSYGKYLELAHGSRLAIIQPTAGTAAAALMRQLRNRWR